MSAHPHLAALFAAAVERSRHENWLGARTSHGWVWHSPTETATAVEEICAGLIELGVAPGERVGLLSENRPEWVFADVAVQHAAAADVPIYPTLPAEQVGYILADAGVRWVFVSTRAQWSKVQSQAQRIDSLEGVICFDPIDGEDLMTLQALREKGRAALGRDRELVRRRVTELTPQHLATLIYTSGTTGTPKGVMLTHENFCKNVEQTLLALRHTFRFGCQAISFLPLCHVLERIVTYCYLEAGMSIGYVPTIERVVDACTEVKPHLLVAVPGVLGLICSRVKARLEKEPTRKRALLFRMIEWGGQESEAMAMQQRLPLWRRLRRGVCERLLYRSIRARLGGRLEAVIVGGAALPIDLCRFFWGIGLPVLEGYGLTETSPVLCVNRKGATRFGTVGQAVPQVELRIAEDGEVLAKGPNVMRGYWNKPEDTATAIVEGWFHTGDRGELDAEGYLKIVGRKKEIIVLSTGKNVAPRLIEDALSASPYILMAVAVGDDRPSMGVLIVPQMEQVRRWAKEQGVEFESDQTLLDHDGVRKLFEKELSRCQQLLADFERAKRYQFLLEVPSEGNGMLTPTKKVRRSELLRRHPELVERLYA